VSVATTRLAGAADFLVLPVYHTFLMTNPQVLACTLRFFEHGYFLSPEQRQPIT
jgi:triacylglycerol lipase